MIFEYSTNNCHCSQMLVKLQKLQSIIVRGIFWSSYHFFMGLELPSLKICGYLQYKGIFNITSYAFIFASQVV